jgi:hypothetical protein
LTSAIISPFLIVISLLASIVISVSSFLVITTSPLAFSRIVVPSAQVVKTPSAVYSWLTAYKFSMDSTILLTSYKVS